MTLEMLLESYKHIPDWFGIDRIDVNTRNKCGDMPIHVAAMNGSPEDIDLLLSAGAEIEIEGEHGFSPLHCAVEFANEKNVRHLLSLGANPAALNSFGDTPLDIAIHLRYNDISKYISDYLSKCKPSK